jgi:hypothetical protein
MSGSHRQPPDRFAGPPALRLVGERRYTKEELAQILNRAAERQEGARTSPQHSSRFPP